jgi:hypothetical protein
VGPLNFVYWYIFRGWTTFMKNQKCEHAEQLKDKIHILFNGDNSWSVALLTHEIWSCKRSWIYAQVLFESSFSLTKLLNIGWCEILRLCWDTSGDTLLKSYIFQGAKCVMHILHWRKVKNIITFITCIRTFEYIPVTFWIYKNVYINFHLHTW